MLGIKVFDAGSATQLVNFRSLNCRRRNVLIRGVRFNDFRVYGGYSLVAAVDEFGGYRKCDIPRGNSADNQAYFAFTGPGGTFNNAARPPMAILPPIGGAPTFPFGA